MFEPTVELIAPAGGRKAPPRRHANSESRTREYLTPDEVERMLTAVRKHGGRMVERDALMLMLGYRHGLRAREIVRLRWEQVDYRNALLHVVRVKAGTPSTHPLRGPELRALRAWQRTQDASGGNRTYVFTTLSKTPVAQRTVHHVIARAGEMAGLPFTAHPHMLRHACGFYLANQGVDTRAIQLYLGHVCIQHTVRYTELSPQRFKDFWKD
jgi:integrase